MIHSFIHICDKLRMNQYDLVLLNKTIEWMGLPEAMNIMGLTLLKP